MDTKFSTVAALLAAATLLAVTAAGAAHAGESRLAAGFELEQMDTSVRPQDNFYEFVNGGWLARTEIPAHRPRWGSFDELAEQAELDVFRIIETALQQERDTDDPDLHKIITLYHTFMDEETIEAAGLAPLEGWLARIDAISDHPDLATAFGELRAAGAIVSLPLAFWVDLDFADPTRYTVYVTQSGLGMPDRDYYLRQDERMAAIRDAYRAYIVRLLILAGADTGEATKAADRIFALEHAIAERHWTRAARRDRQLTFNPVASSQLLEQVPGFDWPNYLAAARLDGQQEIILRELSYFPAMAELVQATPVEIWREYLRFKLLDRTAPWLPAEFADAQFDFHQRTLSGVPEQQARWKRAVDAVNAGLGDAVGREYVARHFPAESRARMEKLVANLKLAFRKSIAALEWMSEDTKAEAQKKLASFGLKIGYPEQWRDYSALEIHRDDLAGNMIRTAGFDYDRMVARLGGPVDRHEWFMTPQTVNAYYSPTRNEIVFPAAILKPPFFNPKADDAVNYGAIGAVIGHEISHGFDDQGRRTDGQGLLRDWWTEEDDARYRELAERLVAQYSAFEPVEGMRIDGQVSLGENIADLAGLTVAHRAYRLSLGDEAAPVIDGFSGDQRFFMGWAQIWRIQYRDDALRRQLVTGPHSPGQYRVIGVVRNIDAFHEAFDVGEDDGMWRAPEERISIW